MGAVVYRHRPLFLKAGVFGTCCMLIAVLRTGIQVIDAGLDTPSCGKCHPRHLPSSDYMRFHEHHEVAKMADPGLISYVRHQILGPSQKPLHLVHYQTHYSQVGQSQLVDHLLGQMTGGFFVECGAADGEELSNTLFLEMHRNWTGILIEADIIQYRQLLSKHRKTYSLNACLSPGLESRVMTFRPVGMLGGLQDTMEDNHLAAVRRLSGSQVTAQCFPLYSIMAALSLDHIHYFSLDVEGAELDVLRSIPWNKLRIDVLSIEYRHYANGAINVTGSREKLGQIRAVLGHTGLYEEAAILPQRGQQASARAMEGYGLDVVFIRKDLVIHTPTPRH